MVPAKKGPTQELTSRFDIAKGNALVLFEEMLEGFGGKSYLTQNLAEQRFGQLTACVERQSGRTTIGMAVEDMATLLSNAFKTKSE